MPLTITFVITLAQSIFAAALFGFWPVGAIVIVASIASWTLGTVGMCLMIKLEEKHQPEERGNPYEVN